MDEQALRDALQKLEALTGATSEASPEATTASDPDGFVTITFGTQVHVKVDRALCPEPDRRDQLQRAIAAAVDVLVRERESGQRAAGEEIGRILHAGAQADLAEPMAALDQRISGIKDQIHDRLARIERRRSRS